MYALLRVYICVFERYFVRYQNFMLVLELSSLLTVASSFAGLSFGYRFGLTLFGSFHAFFIINFSNSQRLEFLYKVYVPFFLFFSLFSALNPNVM